LRRIRHRYRLIKSSPARRVPLHSPDGKPAFAAGEPLLAIGHLAMLEISSHPAAFVGRAIPSRALFSKVGVRCEIFDRVKQVSKKSPIRESHPLCNLPRGFELYVRFLLNCRDSRNVIITVEERARGKKTSSKLCCSIHAGIQCRAIYRNAGYYGITYITLH